MVKDDPTSLVGIPYFIKYSTQTDGCVSFDWYWYFCSGTVVVCPILVKNRPVFVSNCFLHEHSVRFDPSWKICTLDCLLVLGLYIYIRYSCRYCKCLFVYHKYIFDNFLAAIQFSIYADYKQFFFTDKCSCKVLSIIAILMSIFSLYVTCRLWIIRLDIASMSLIIKFEELSYFSLRDVFLKSLWIKRLALEEQNIMRTHRIKNDGGKQYYWQFQTFCFLKIMLIPTIHS